MRRSSVADFAVQLAREAGRLIRSSSRPRRIRLKSSHADIRTGTDLAVERFIVRRIRSRFPEHQIVAEESFEGLPAGDRPLWLIDPIDGTTNYFRGVPFFGCNIALWADGAVRLGVVVDAARRIVYWAEAGRGSWAKGRRLRVSEVRELPQAVLATGFPYDRGENPDNNLAEVSAVLPRARAVRTMGCAGLDLVGVAAGRLDGYWEAGTGPWDSAAGSLLVREAGGEVTTYQGDPWTPTARTVLATNGRIHQALLDLIGAARLDATP